MKHTEPKAAGCTPPAHLIRSLSVWLLRVRQRSRSSGFALAFLLLPFVVISVCVHTQRVRRQLTHAGGHFQARCTKPTILTNSPSFRLFDDMMQHTGYQGCVLCATKRWRQAMGTLSRVNHECWPDHGPWWHTFTTTIAAKAVNPPPAKGWPHKPRSVDIC